MDLTRIPYRQALAEIINKEGLVEDICAHLANGGDLITMAEAYGVRYSDLTGWLSADKERARLYGAALLAREEWMAQRLLVELRAIGESDIRDAFNPDGTMRAPSEWPAGLAKAIASVETDICEDVTSTKIKLWPKIEALKLQMQKLGMLIDKRETTVRFDVSDRMAELEEARRRALAASAPPVIEVPHDAG